MSADLVIADITKRFGGVTALNGVSLEIDRRGSTGVIGPNGSGKTTLFNVITGYFKPDSGSIAWLGQPIVGRRPHDIARLGLVRTFQQTMLFPKFTVHRNVDVAAMSAGIHGRDRRTVVDSALEMLGIREYADEPAGKMPFGIARRIGIACALPLRPKLLLLDEPAAGLNSQEVTDLATALHAMQSEEYGICLVDHNMDFVTGFCKRVIVMNAGRPLADGTPEEMIRDPRVAEVYLGHAAEG